MKFDNEKDESVFKGEIRRLLGEAIGQDYVEQILDYIYEDVKEDVELCADDNAYSEGDCKLAIGRILVSRIG